MLPLNLSYYQLVKPLKAKQEATRNKGIATSNKGISTSSKKLLVTGDTVFTDCRR